MIWRMIIDEKDVECDGDFDDAGTDIFKLCKAIFRGGRQDAD
jgi:hypothetical protein